MTSELNSVHNFSLENIFHSCSKQFKFFTHLAVKLGSDLEPCHIKLVPIKTLQSLHSKFMVINESFETNLDCTIITRD